MLTPRQLVGRFIYRWFLSAERRRRRWLKDTPAERLDPQFWATADLLRLISTVDPDVREIWDVGANRGHWAILARSFFPRSSIVCFEPLETLRRTLEKVAAELGSVRLVSCATGAQPGQAVFYETAFSDCSSLLPPRAEGAFADALRVRNEITVTVRRLDEIQRTENLPPPDLIKCDIQGAELDALRGATAVLPSVRWLLIEAQFVAAYENAARPAELIAFLDQHGFDLVGLERDTETWQALNQGDLLFRRRASAAP